METVLRRIISTVANIHTCEHYELSHVKQIRANKAYLFTSKANLKVTISLSQESSLVTAQNSL